MPHEDSEYAEDWRHLSRHTDPVTYAHEHLGDRAR